MKKKCMFMLYTLKNSKYANICKIKLHILNTMTLKRISISLSIT